MVLSGRAAAAMELNGSELIALMLLGSWLLKTMVFGNHSVARKQRGGRVAMTQDAMSQTDPMPTVPPPTAVYIATRCGAKFHVHTECAGLNSAVETRRFDSCSLCW